MIHATSKISLSNLEMPKPAVTYKEIMDEPKKYCAQCVFSGGMMGKDNSCQYSELKLANLKRGHKGTNVLATLDQDIEYYSLFENLSVCFEYSST